MRNWTGLEKAIIVTLLFSLLAASWLVVWLYWEPVILPFVRNLLGSSEVSEMPEMPVLAYPCRFEVVRLQKDSTLEAVCLESPEEVTIVALFKGCFCGSNYHWALKELLPLADQLAEQGVRFVFVTPDEDAGFKEFALHVEGACRYVGVNRCPEVVQDPGGRIASFFGVTDIDSGLPKTTLIALAPGGDLICGVHGLPGLEPDVELFMRKFEEKRNQ